MTTDGWEQRLADLGQAREESIDLTPGVVWTDAQLSIVRDLAARSAKARAAVERVRELAADFDDGSEWGTVRHPGHMVRNSILAALDGPS